MRILKPSGKAFLEFHHTSRSRTLGIASDSLLDVKHYDLDELKLLLADAGVSEYELFPMGYAPRRLVFVEWLYGIVDYVSAFFLPNLSHLVVITKR